MGHKEKLKGGDEQDAFSSWKQFEVWRPGERKGIKRAFNRRLRRRKQQELKKSEDRNVKISNEVAQTIDELAESQNVKSMVDVRALFGTWPGEEDDGLEELLNELRHQSTGSAEEET